MPGHVPASTPLLRSREKAVDGRDRPGHDEELQRRIDRFVVFLLEARDQFGGRQDLGDAADALA